MATISNLTIASRNNGFTAAGMLDGVSFNSIGVSDGQGLAKKWNRNDGPWNTSGSTELSAFAVNAVDIDWNGAFGIFGFTADSPLKTTGQLLKALSDASANRPRTIVFNTSRASAVSVSDTVNGGTVSGYQTTSGTASILYLPEYPTWATLSGKPSLLSIGTTSTTAAAGNHTHTTSLAADTGTSSILLASGGKYKLTAGGTSVIFAMPTIPAATTSLAWSAITSKPNFATVATSGSYNDLTNKPTILSIGTTSTTAAAGNHTHSVSITSTPNTSASIELQHDQRYTLTAGGNTTVFKMPAASGHTTSNTVSKTYSAPSGQYISTIKVDSNGHIIDVLYTNFPVTQKTNPTLTINNPASTTIADGGTTTISVTSNVAGKLTLTTASGTGWSATSSSANTAATSHTITVTNLTSTTTAGSIAIGGIVATFTPTDTTNYNTLTGQSVLKQAITLAAPVTLSSIQWVSTSASSTYGQSIAWPQIQLNYSNGTNQKIAGNASGVTYSTSLTSSTNVGVYSDITATYQSKTTTNKLSYTISRANLNLTVNINGWTAGSTPSTPTVSGNTGNGQVTYKYKVSTAADSTYTTTVPTTAGTYIVQATVAVTTNYNSATATKQFTISAAPKTNPTLTVYNPSSTSIADGGTTTIPVKSSVPGKLTLTTASGTGWTATSDSASTAKTDHYITITNLTSVTTAGTIPTSGIIATFTPTDTTHYNTLTGQNMVVLAITLQAGNTIITNKWFKGDSNPATLTSVGQTKTSFDTWTTATSITGTRVSLVDDDLNDHTWYFAFPTSWNVTTMLSSDNSTPVPTTSYTVTNNVSIAGSPFTVFKMNSASDSISVYFR